ncbi:hypothetical protein DSM104299_04093 [Baekduia alba]|uniref:endo alpha-1,4 polygalactosaminidase n=1 Tax=Baekduia alba TaxID=2997333 RepID=UPI002341F598|nr:endo alpha-1,4 polygalactosaminidase [Baekduia alba]WCB95350.1 hypothetical protein DSM104299_04093 [Baekduia alba]
MTSRIRSVLAALTLAAALFCVAAAAATADTTNYKRPPLHARFQYQLQPVAGHDATGGYNIDICAPAALGGPCVRPQVWGIDLYEADGVTPNRRAVQAIHARGGYALCYIDAGSIENYRPDWAEFKAWDDTHGHSLIGKPYSELFPEEFYANVNNDRGQRDFLLAMQEQRMRKCARAGFDAVDPDVVDAYAAGAAETGWEISAGTQLVFNRALARTAHQLGMAVTLKADLGQTRELVGDVDMAVNEQCFQYDECDALRPFARAGKPVFEIEYDVAPLAFCPKAVLLYGFNAAKKDTDEMLYDLPWTPCL